MPIKKVIKMITDEEIINICNSSQTMAQACAKLGLHYSTFQRRSQKLGCYKPNKKVKTHVNTLIKLFHYRIF